MKVAIRNVLFVVIAITSTGVGCTKYSGKPMYLRNNSDQTIYYWYAHWMYDSNHRNYHYPDTTLPSRMPTRAFWSIRPNSAAGICGVSRIPDWVKIFSELPVGKFSIYIFTKRIQTQEEWDSVRKNNNFYRKDVTYQEFIDNDYYIDFP